MSVRETIATLQISKFIIGVAVCFFVGCAATPKPPIVPVPTPPLSDFQTEAAAGDKQKLYDDKKDSYIGSFKPKKPVDDKRRKGKELSPEVPTTEERQQLAQNTSRKPSSKKVPSVKTRKPAKPPKHIPKPKPTWRAGGGRLIVVSLSNTFGGQQKVIHNGFFEVLKAKKGKSRSFTLYTIQSGRQPRVLLTSSQLRSLSVEGGSHSILGKLEMGMRFGARDLWALGDLSNLIGKKRKQIGKVLYITDNKRINAANKKQRDILLEWKKAGGRLKVLTTGSCSVWNQVGATCRGIGNLKGTLRGFI